MTTGSLQASTILVLFSFICIFVIIGLSIWVIKLTKRLNQYEASRLHRVQSHSNASMQSFVYEINSQSASMEPTNRHTPKVLLDDASSPDIASETTPTNTNCRYGVSRIVLVPPHTEFKPGQHQIPHLTSSIK